MIKKRPCERGRWCNEEFDVLLGRILQPAQLPMTDDPCRGVRAQARSLEQEVALLRGAVAALRESSRRNRSRETHHDPRRWKIATVTFFVGVVVGALTLIALTRCL